ncbi:SusF/SusE family outer membrane protein [Salinimicrobium sediminilitoris]|uniref:SusF/SusE family outer membrane protein n=1 Tax=Salinimicrobium sediminilitoris TaxID=2876715 RepID=UPI001E4D8FA1|nr:SusF/SusE family outer membrane protein [Salinimicrobium sediminilitoris]MCC8358843.1 SusF/SusE family outer membrane protein [Salinimicrobium sediminilitoris]
MKKLSILLLAFVALIGFNACTSDDDVVFIANPDAEGIQFTNTFSSTYDLTVIEPEDVIERFVWNEIDVDVPTNLTYELQASLSEDFESMAVLGRTPKNNLDVTAQQLIKIVNDEEEEKEIEINKDEPITFYFKVVASPGTAQDMAHTSDVVSFSALLPSEAALTNFYLVGDATAAGWNPDNNNTPLFRDAENENIFYFTGRFAGGDGVEGFKLLETLGQWQPQWGLDNGELSSSEILGGDPSAFPVDADAYYSLTINIDEMTYSFETYDASTQATYNMIGLVGAGTTVGWPNDDNPAPDVLLTKSDFDPHLWYAKDVELLEDGIKFRANQDWGVNWGGGENFPSGQATGDDIIVTKAGIYNVWFNDLTGRYIFNPQVEE